MSLVSDVDLKDIMRLIHQKGVVTASYLQRQGVSYQRMLKYRRADWLSPLGVGAFCEAGTAPSFDSAFVALSEQLKLPVHLGGKTALARRGILQFAPVGGMRSDVYLKRGFRLPKWFLDTFDGQFIRKSSTLFEGETGVEKEGNGLAISAPERAYLELAAEVPDKMSVGELYQLMESADSLRPDLVEALLRLCGSIKAKRVFLLLADDLGHWWRKRIDMTKIDLGSGCRLIDKGGDFHSKYNLIVKPWKES